MKLFAAGGESRISFLPKEMARIPYILFSFYTLKKYSDITPHMQLMKRAAISILDSGAFSFLYGAGKNEDTDLTAYIADYIKTVKGYGIKNYIELDLDGKYNLATINSLRKEMEKKIGWPAIPCWHVSRGKEELLKLAREYDYIAIGGLVRAKREEIINAVVTTLRGESKIPKIHLMGVHEKKYFNSIFYSCDSSEALAGIRGGRIVRFSQGDFYSVRNNNRLPYKTAVKLSIEAQIAAAKYYDERHYGEKAVI